MHASIQFLIYTPHILEGLENQRGFIWFHRRGILKSVHSSVKAPAISVTDVVVFIAKVRARRRGAKGNRIMKYHPCISPPQARKMQ